jgi:capsular polysaccharide biosynthesis protein
MQLRYYFSIVLRFWLLIVVLPLAVALLSLWGALQQPPRYGASARLMITQTPLVPQQPGLLEDFDLDYNYYHSWINSEFILDDLPQVVTSRAFAQDVSTLLAARGLVVSPETVQSSLRADNLHRAVTISSNTNTPEIATALVQGAVETLQVNGLKYWNRTYANSSGLNVVVLDPVGAAAPLNSTRQLVFNVGLRTALALAAAIGLAFLLHYLDTTIRDARQVQEWLGIDVVGVIPKE